MAHISRRATLRVWLQERDARRVWVQDTLFVASAPSALLPIHEAARYWDVDQIQELISKGVNPDYKIFYRTKQDGNIFPYFCYFVHNIYWNCISGNSNRTLRIYLRREF